MLYLLIENIEPKTLLLSSKSRVAEIRAKVFNYCTYTLKELQIECILILTTLIKPPKADLCNKARSNTSSLSFYYVRDRNIMHYRADVKPLKRSMADRG